MINHMFKLQGLTETKEYLHEAITPVICKQTNSRQAGFSLLETLVAFSVLTIVLGVVFQVFAGGARSQRLASEYSQAVSLAQSVITMAKYGSPQESGILYDHYHWQLLRSPYEPPELLSDQTQKPYMADKLTVTVTWTNTGKERQVKLAGIKLSNYDD
jgi:general secretion pathway protein I